MVVEGSLERRIRRACRSNQRAGGVIPHDIRVDNGRLARRGAHGTFRGLDTHVAHAEIRAVFLNKEGRNRLRLHEVGIHKLVVDDVVRHAQHKRAVGCGANGDINIGMRGARRELRVDSDKLRAILTRVAYVMPIVDVCLGGVSAPCHDGFRIGDIGSIVARNAKQRRLLVNLSVVCASAKHRCAQRGNHAAITDRHIASHLAIQNAIAAIGRPKRDRRSAGLLHGGAHFPNDGIDCLVPANALPLALAALARSFHGILQAIRIVDALRLRIALHAKTTARRIVARQFSRSNAHYFAITHNDIRGALASAVASARRANDSLPLGCSRIGRLRFRHRRQTAHGDRARAERCSTGGFQKSPTCNASRFQRFRWIFHF